MFWDHKTIKAPYEDIDTCVQEAGKAGWEPYSAVIAEGGVFVFLRKELALNPNVGTVKIATKNRGAYIPGMPAGSAES